VTPISIAVMRARRAGWAVVITTLRAARASRWWTSTRLRASPPTSLRGYTMKR
jgi:hypothetical protein